MNLDNFDYSPKPFTKIKKFEIHPLSDEGKKLYKSKQAFTHRYLKSFYPARVDELFEKKSSLRSQRTNGSKKSTKENEIESQEDAEAEREDSECKQSLQVLSPKVSYKSSNFPTQFFQSPDHRQTMTLKKPFRFTRTKFWSPIKKKSAQPDSMKYSQNYIDTYKSLKKTLSNFKSMDNDSKLLSSLNGFTCSKVPRIENSKSTNKLLSTKNKKCEKYFERSGEPENENEKLKTIYRKNLDLENRKEFPKISEICNQNKILTQKIRVMNNKLMGEKYNPMNYHHDKIQSTIRRNQYGALFQH